jgi:glycosyltransferase involved in cell wall biosynthesis
MGGRNLVSVVVPTYCRPRLLRDCLVSLLEQTYDHSRYEIIVVADGPQDDARETVAQLSRLANAPAIRYVEIEHRGPGAARNAGIAAATGSLLCFVDDDVQAPRPWLERMVSGIGARDGLVCFGGPIRDRFDVALPRTCARCTVRTAQLDEGEVEREVEAVYGGNIAIPRAAFERVGPFDEALQIYCQGDSEWVYRLRQAGGTVVYLPDPWVWHHKTAADLGFGRLVRTHLRYGYGDAAYWVATRQPGLGREAVRLALSIPLRVGHAARHRCWNGILGICLRVGFVAGALVHLLSKRGASVGLARPGSATATARHDAS